LFKGDDGQRLIVFTITAVQESLYPGTLLPGGIFLKKMPSFAILKGT